MGTIRPALTNFALGELSPKLAGRVDLPLYTKGALEMTNVAPLPLGGCGKRGGLEYKLAIDAAAAGACRMIPWSISNEIDILVLLFDGYIKFLNVSGGMNPSFIQQTNDADVLEDVRIETIGSASECYAEEDISSVRYAQTLNMLVMVHQNYPVMHIKAEYTFNTTTAAYSIILSYGPAGVQGNIAVTPYVETSDVVFKEFYGADVIAALEAKVTTDPLQLTETKTYTAALDDVSGKIIDDTGTERDITSISITRTSYANTVFVGGTGKTGSSPGNLSSLFNYSPINVGTNRHGDSYRYGLFNWFKGYQVKLDGYLGSLSAGDSWGTVVSFASRRMVSGSNYIMSQLPTDWKKTDPVRAEANYKDISFSFRSAYSIYSFSIYFTGGAGVISYSQSDAQDLPRRGSISIGSQNIVINGYSVAMIDMVDKLAPWMVEDKEYSCDPEFKLNGKTPKYARKTTVDGEPVVTVFFVDGTSFDLSRASTGRLLGQVGVNLVPFAGAGDCPSVVAFHQGRCCLGGSDKEPNVLHMSKVNDYFNFAYFEEIEYIQTAMKPKDEWADPDTPQYETKTNILQQVGSSSAIYLVIATDENEAIQSIVAQDDLFIGTSTSEWIFPAGLTALNPRVSLVSRYGSANLQARFIRDAIMFVGSSGKTVRAFGSPGADLMQYAEHIAKAGIISFDFRQEPYNELYLVLANGTAVVGRLGDEGVAWFRIATKEGDLIESVACIRASDEDAAYFIVKRIIGASTVRTIERMVTTDDSAFASRFYLDSATITPVTAGSTSINATRFIGETITIRGVRKSGGTEFSGTAVVPGNGTVTAFIDDADTSAVPAAVPLPEFTQVIFGLPYNSAIETMRLDAVDTAGLLKKADAVFFRCYETGPFDLVVKHPAPAGDPTDTEDRFPITAPTYDGVIQYPYTGTIRYENMDPWSTEQTIRLESNGSTPLGIQLIIPQYQVGDSL